MNVDVKYPRTREIKVVRAAMSSKVFLLHVPKTIVGVAVQTVNDIRYHRVSCFRQIKEDSHR